MTNQKRILYIDDEEQNLTGFKAVFRRLYEIDTVTSPQLAFEKLAIHQYDIIISDQRMPGMTGVQFFEKMKDSHPDPIRMILTGYSNMQAIVDSINKGNIYQYITKPWKFENLKIILDKALEVKVLRERNTELFRQNVLAQYDVLKNQINPHFLFNCMSTLHTLISIDTEKARKFTIQFSDLYRSLLQVNSEQLIPLKTELSFIDTYIDLQKIRYDTCLHIHKDIENAASYFVPPFAVQLLVENAIKHNVISENTNLHIELIQQRDVFIVKNSLCKRRDSIEKVSGKGLENLKLRYEMMGVDVPIIKETPEYFKVEVVLIKEEE